MVNDTFLLGSGTKTFTAVALLRRLAELGLPLDEPIAERIDAYLLEMGRPRLESYFGRTIENATAWQVLSMTAHVRDMEDTMDFDADLLEYGDKFWDFPYASMEYTMSETNLAGTNGAAVGEKIMSDSKYYSSTSYVLAGLLLLALEEEPRPEWYDFDVAAAALRNEHRDLRSISFFPKGLPEGGLNGSAPIGDAMGINGYSIKFGPGRADLRELDSSVLGWSVGGMVANTVDMARFFYRLFTDPTRFGIAPDVLQRMRELSPVYMNQGNGIISAWDHYGAGLMQISLHGEPLSIGHEGITFGFGSAAGYVEEMGGALSIYRNSDTCRLDIATPLKIIRASSSGTIKRADLDELLGPNC